MWVKYKDPKSAGMYLQAGKLKIEGMGSINASMKYLLQHI